MRGLSVVNAEPIEQNQSLLKAAAVENQVALCASRSALL